MPLPPRARLTGIDADDWDLVGWSDVVAEGKVRLGQSLGFEEPSIGITRDEIVVPPTHCQRSEVSSPNSRVSRGRGLHVQMTILGQWPFGFGPIPRQLDAITVGIA